MTTKTTKKDTTITELEILKINTGRVRLPVIGTTPLLCNAMNTHGLQALLAPPKKKNRAEKETSLKHDPYREYRASVYRAREQGAATVIQMPSAAFKGAMAGTGKDLPGASKAALARWMWVVGERVNIFGTPRLSMMMVRNSDANHTPDVRSRAILPRWACFVDVAFLQPMLGPKSILNLLCTGGILQGIGDGRQEKGKLNFGCFTVCDESDAEFQSILKEGAAAQAEGLARPVPYDEQTEGLLTYFDEAAAGKNLTTERDLQ